MSAEPRSEDLANRTIQRISHALEKRQIASVPEVIHLIQELSTKAFSITVRELAEIISQDVAVTAKVISAANTVGYNPTGVPVNTVSQSIHVIGFERVRNLAISLLLVQNAEQAMSAQEQREAAAFALSSGLLAQAMMEQQGSSDPEQAFVCTSLRNYGRLLMTTFLIEEYRDAIDRATQVGEDKAFREVFGLTPLELSYHLLLSSHLPKDILRSLQTLPTTLVHSAALRPEDELLLMADMSVKLCALATSAELEPAQFKRSANGLIGAYGKHFKMNEEEITGVFQTAVSRMRAFSQTYGIRSVTTNTMRYMMTRAEEKHVPEELKLAPPVMQHRRRRNPRASAAEPLAARVELSSRTVAPGGTVRSIALGPASRMPDEAPVQVDPLSVLDGQVLLAGIDTIVAALGRSPFNIREVHSACVESLKKGLALTDVLLFERKDEDAYVVVEGVGALHDSVRGRLGLISPQQRSVFGISLSRREDVLIEDGRDPKISQYIPQWMRLNAPVHSLLLLPIHDGETVSGLMCGLRASAPPLRLGNSVLQTLRAMRIHLATAARLTAPRQRS